MISYFNRNNRHAYDRSMYLSIRSSNSSSFITEVNNMPINIIGQEIFNHSNTRFNFDLLRRCMSSNIALTNNSRSFSMIFYPNRKRRFFNISSRIIGSLYVIVFSSTVIGATTFTSTGGLYLNHFSLGRST